ncbi:hypothetical protein [Pseudomonas rubra]|uniref:Thioredoxin n=1 Tax=Pseudomonas rubra TaxID=2942627 RepID=A0ABT5PEV8_9PSED|nr:hypothetical protein [Pseudomonas rubra]MDD1016667.1 hypothetical protein [Pseudomonas rubra]MDD1040991.1 hypothetical protein [Pseudomonas rubra]MDD1153547.1 hypothetical protein [Pseudomonas rubra]
MIDTSDAVQDEFTQVVLCLKNQQPLARPVVIMVHEDNCPACATGKDNLRALAEDGYRGKVDFYLSTFHTFQGLYPSPEVEVIPTQLLFDCQGSLQLLATGASVEQLRKALEGIFPAH